MAPNGRTAAPGTRGYGIGGLAAGPILATGWADSGGHRRAGRGSPDRIGLENQAIRRAELGEILARGPKLPPGRGLKA
jgi:hypothetical protein